MTSVNSSLYGIVTCRRRILNPQPPQQGVALPGQYNRAVGVFHLIGELSQEAIAQT